MLSAIQKLASAGAGKGRFLAENPLGLWLSAAGAVFMAVAYWLAAAAA